MAPSIDPRTTLRALHCRRHCRSGVLRSMLAAWPCTASHRLSAFLSGRRG